MSVIHDIFEKVKQRDPDQPEFHQAVWEVLESLEPVLEAHPEYVEAGIVERCCRGFGCKGLVQRLSACKLRKKVGTIPRVLR